MKTDNNTKIAAVAAVLVGLFAVIAVNKYIATKTAVAPTPKASILVATMEIKEGSEIGEEMLGSAEIPFESLSNMHIALPAKDDPGYQKALSDAIEKIVKRKAKRLIAANTPVFWIDIETEPKTPFTDLIADGCRAVTVPVDSVSSVCGFIKPGSRIDVVLTATEEGLGLVTGQAAKETGSRRPRHRDRPRVRPAERVVRIRDDDALASDEGGDHAGAGAHDGPDHVSAKEHARHEDDAGPHRSDGRAGQLVRRDGEVVSVVVSC